MANVVSKDRHVAVLPFPFSSHPGGLLNIVTRLAAAAPNFSFSFYSTSKSIETLFAPAKRVPGNIKPYVVSDGMPDGYVFSGNPLEAINLYIAAAEEGQSLKGVLKVAEAETGKTIGCVMSDAFLWFAGDLAEEMGVPWVSFWCGGANSCAAHFYTDLIRDTVGMHDIAGRKNEVVNFVPGFPELRLGDLPPEILFGNSESPFVIMLHKMGRVLPKATAVFLNSFEEIVPDINQDLKSKLKMLLNVGPSNLLSSLSWPTPPPPSSYSDEYGCIPWLDNFKAVSVAYIGFGTILTPSPAEIAALAEALEASGTPFLWSLRDNLKEFFPQGFMERTSKLGKIVPWAPQQQILAHSSVGVSVSHCGWNSVLESIVAGVPLIGRPFFADNLLNAWMVEKVWKIGVRLEGGVFTKNSTMLALELVLNHEKGKEMREQIGKYKELAWKAVGPEGSSTQNFNTLLEVRKLQQIQTIENTFVLLNDALQGPGLQSGNPAAH